MPILISVLPPFSSDLCPSLCGAVVQPQVIVAVALVNATKDEQIVVINCASNVTRSWRWSIGCMDQCPLGLLLSSIKLIDVIERLSATPCTCSKFFISANAIFWSADTRMSNAAVRILQHGDAHGYGAPGPRSLCHAGQPADAWATHFCTAQTCLHKYLKHTISTACSSKEQKACAYPSQGMARSSCWDIAHGDKPLPEDTLHARK